MGELALGMSMLAAGILVGGAVVVYIFRYFARGRALGLVGEAETALGQPVDLTGPSGDLPKWLTTHDEVVSSPTVLRRGAYHGRGPSWCVRRAWLYHHCGRDMDSGD